MRAERFRKFTGESIVVALVWSLNSGPATAENLAVAASRVRNSVVLVEHHMVIGTAFAIRSGTNGTILLTAAHVVGCRFDGTGCEANVDVYLNGDNATPHRSQVLAHGRVDHDDLALLGLPGTKLPAVAFANASVPSGTAIAVLGYPDSTVAEAQSSQSAEANVDLSLLLGATASSDDSVTFEFTGESYHGDSGAPIFIPSSGEAVGVVHGRNNADSNYVGISRTAIRMFLGSNEQAIASFLRMPSSDLGEGSRTNPANCQSLIDQAARAQCYRDQADRGDLHAAFLAAEILLLPKMVYGNGNPLSARQVARNTDPAEGLRYLRMAAEGHDIDAELLLGNSYALGMPPLARDTTTGNYWLQRCWDDARERAGHGDLHAMFVEASMLKYTTLSTVSPDASAARTILISCAGRGGTECADDLANSARFETPPDLGAAVKWWRVSAAAGDKTAMFQLGDAYEKGAGVTPDLATAISWYKLALPNMNADVALARLHIAHPGLFGQPFR